MYKKRMYAHKEGWLEYTQVKREQTIEVCLYLSIKGVSVLCIDKKTVCVWKGFDMYKEILCTQKNVMGLTPRGRPIGLKAVSQGIMLLSIPMEYRCINKRMKTNGRSLFMFEY